MSNPWFASLDAPVFDAFVAAAQRKMLQAGGTLYRRGDVPSDSVYVALTGSIRLSGTSSEGREAVFTFFQPDNLFAEVGPFGGQDRSHDATAHVTMTLLNVTTARLHALMVAHSAWEPAVLPLNYTRAGR